MKAYLDNGDMMVISKVINATRRPVVVKMGASEIPPVCGRKKEDRAENPPTSPQVKPMKPGERPLGLAAPSSGIGFSLGGLKADLSVHVPNPSGRLTPIRVAAPGEKPERFLSIRSASDVPIHYSKIHGFSELATDPASKGILTPVGLREAMSGLETGFLSYLRLPLIRGPVTIEFFDADGHPYDVKTPRSPLEHERWGFNAGKAVRSILKKMRGVEVNPCTREKERVRIILDSTYLTKEDHESLWSALGPQLSEEEAHLLVEINVRFSDE